MYELHKTWCTDTLLSISVIRASVTKLDTVGNGSGFGCEGESTLKFVWYILHQTHELVPSFTEVKKFVLPGFEQPQKVELI